MYEHDTPFHRIRVTDNDGVRLLKFERNQQSTMLIADPLVTLRAAMHCRAMNARTWPNIWATGGGFDRSGSHCA